MTDRLIHSVANSQKGTRPWGNGQGEMHELMMIVGTTRMSEPGADPEGVVLGGGGTVMLGLFLVFVRPKPISLEV